MPSIDAIGGIGPRSARQLRRAGVKTTDGLLRRAGNKRGREALAEAAGLAEPDILAWVNTADLMRIKGVGSEYANLLSMTGVTTVKELRRRNPKTLTTALVALNDKKRLVRRLPTEAMVSEWVDAAKDGLAD